MYFGLTKYIYLISKKILIIWLYTVLLGIIVVMAPSCGSSKQSSGMRQMEKHSKKNPVGDDGLPVVTHKSGSKKVRQALAQQEKQKAAEKKEADKAYKDAITRHRSIQTQETRERMDRHLKESNKRHSKEKEFFVVRWFQPKDEIEKIEKRQAKEDQKRMADTRRKAEKNNKDLGFSSVSKTKEKKKPLPTPNDMPHGGGGVYKEGSATRYASPSGVQHGGGGSYAEGKSGGRKASDFQHGGGGSYQTGKSGKGIKSSDAQHGGGGSYQAGKSGNGPKPSDSQHGGGGNMSGKTKKPKTKSKK